jgi:proline iminopeptidase
MSAYHRRLTSSDAKTRVDAARAWSVWEGATSFLYPDEEHIAGSGED